MEKIKIGDIVRVEDCHHAEPRFYEVSIVEEYAVISQPAYFSHRKSEITAIYRNNGKDFVCIWRR